MSQRALPRRWEALSVVAITLLAAILRLACLTEIPPGLHFDEGFKGVTARGLLAGDPPRLFFEGNMGEEPIDVELPMARRQPAVGRPGSSSRAPAARRRSVAAISRYSSSLRLL